MTRSVSVGALSLSCVRQSSARRDRGVGGRSRICSTDPIPSLAEVARKGQGFGRTRSRDCSRLSCVIGELQLRFGPRRFAHWKP
jgi:hypothetical protein